MVFDSHPTIVLGPFVFAAHAMLFTLGSLVAFMVLRVTAGQRGLPGTGAARMVALSFLAGLIGARLGYVISYPSGFHSLLEIASYWEGGLVSYWGILTGAVMAWYLIRRETDRAQWIDCLVIATLAGWAVGRWGNYWAMDSVGLPSGFWGAFYGRVPIQLFESVLCAVLAAVGLFYRQWKPAVAAVVLASGYFLGRFVIDFWRDDNVYLSQWISLSVGVLIIIWWNVCKRR